MRVEYYHYTVVDSIAGGNESQRAAEAAECANEQGMFWEYHDTLYDNQRGEGQGAFNDDRLRGFASTLGLDTTRFNECFDAGRYSGVITGDENKAQGLGVTGTPTLFINGRRVPQDAILDFNALKQLIDAELAKP